MNHPLLPKNLFAFIWYFLKPYKFITFVFISTAFLAGFWEPFNSMLVKDIVNAISYSPTINTSLAVQSAFLLVLNFIVFDNVTWRLIEYIVYRYLPIIKNNITNTLFQYVLQMEYKFFQDKFSGSISNNITILADDIEEIISQSIPNLIRGSSLVIIALTGAYYVNNIFFIVMLTWLVMFISTSFIISRKIIFLSNPYAKSESDISGQIVDSITNANNIRIFAGKNYEVARLEKFLSKRLNAFRKQELLIIIMNVIQGTLISIMLGFLLYFLISLYNQKLIMVGDFALILGLAMELGHMIWWTMSVVDEFNKSYGECNQCLTNLILPININDKENASDLIVKKGKIVFQNVQFSYNQDMFFQNKSITIEAGQKVGLVGYSGSGKSTFVNLILRLYDVLEGSISIDGQDIRNVTQESLRNAITLIPQDPSLFNRSLLENISYGNINSSYNNVVEAAKFAHADVFISELPDRYNTLVGERGIKLSGGQRQRIAIARGFLKNSPILILDEATSQLDSVTEEYIQESLKMLMQGKTTIIIAHRLSTLLNMDRILVFDKGKIVEDGSHLELLPKNGLYKTLWDAQIGGFLVDKID